MAGDLMERGRRLCKDRALFVQIQIRNRFRVAVDRRRHRKLESDYSLTVSRWFRKLWPDPTSCPSKPRASYIFYRKRVGKVVDGVDDSAVVRMLQSVALPVIGNACHVFMHGLNHVKIYGAEKLHQALLERPKGKPLLTVSNHVAAMDDPFVIASLLPPNIMLDTHNLRWTLCATNRCFSNPVLSSFFRCLKVLPVSRGDGVYQKGMDMALSKLNSGGWVHIFPEGSRSRDGGKTVGPAKRGVGRLVMDADIVPLVIPFAHTGMQEIMPVGTKLPKVGKQVTVVVGDPIDLEDLLVCKDTCVDNSRGILYDTVSSRIGHHLQALKVEAEKLALEQQFELEEHRTKSDGEHNGYGIWQQVDWEAFGMENVMSSSSSSNRSQIVKQQAPLNQPMEEEFLMPNSTQHTIRTCFSYEGGIMSRVGYYVNPSEFMGFAAKGFFTNRELFNIQEARPVRAWKQFMNDRKQFFEGSVYRPYIQ